MLGEEGEGVGFQDEAAVCADDFEFVVGAGADAGDEDFPDAAFDAFAHGVGAAVPAVEISDDADPLGVGCPDGEGGAGDVADGAGVGAEDIVEGVVGAFGEVVDILFPEDVPERIGVGLFGSLAVVGFPTEAIGEGFWADHR